MSLALRHISLLLLAVAGLSAGATEERTFTVINAASGLADNGAQPVACSKGGWMIISTTGSVNLHNGSSSSHIVTLPEYRYPLPQYSDNDRLSLRPIPSSLAEE